MSGIKTLIDELETQKEVITRMSGVVIQNGKHPSPAEITQGIKTIPSTDLSAATATEADVAQGKTFFAGNALIKTGTSLADPLKTQALFCYPEKTVSFDGEIEYVLPDNLTRIRKYAFYNNYNTISLTFSDNLTRIEDYAFYGTQNFYFENFNELTNLTYVGTAAFQNSGGGGLDVCNLPDSIETLQISSFYDVPVNYPSYTFPNNLKSMGNNVFRQSVRTLANTVDYSNYKLTSTQGYTFMCVAFNCDLVLPDTITHVGDSYNLDGCFKSVTLPAGLKTIYTNAFGGLTTSPVSNFYCEWVEFKGEKPPTIQANIFAKQNIQNGFKIYVPDNSVEAYKAVSNLSSYVDCIVPVSEKE